MLSSDGAKMLGTSVGALFAAATVPASCCRCCASPTSSSSRSPTRRRHPLLPAGLRPRHARRVLARDLVWPVANDVRHGRSSRLDLRWLRHRDRKYPRRRARRDPVRLVRRPARPDDDARLPSRSTPPAPMRSCSCCSSAPPGFPTCSLRAAPRRRRHDESTLSPRMGIEHEVGSPRLHHHADLPARLPVRVDRDLLDRTADLPAVPARLDFPDHLSRQDVDFMPWFATNARRGEPADIVHDAALRRDLVLHEGNDAAGRYHGATSVAA